MADGFLPIRNNAAPPAWFPSSQVFHTARSAFCLPRMRAALAAGVISLAPAVLFADQAVVCTGETTVTAVQVRDTDAPGAVAEVVFLNDHCNDGRDEGDYTITHNGLTYVLTFGFNVAPGGADSIIITPPPGFVAIPEYLELLEGYEATALIYQGGLS